MRTRPSVYRLAPGHWQLARERFGFTTPDSRYEFLDFPTFREAIRSMTECSGVSTPGLTVVERGETTIDADAVSGRQGDWQY